FALVHCPSCGQRLRARRQFNHFKLIELIGQGGMGNVFKATDCNLNRLVALKVLKKELASKPEEVEKLAAESRVTASINHPHVVKVFSFGQDHGQFYMAMELVERGSLDDLMMLQKRVPEAQVLEVSIQIAQGLEAALDHGLIHRDIKPGNILFADAHTAKLVDFGLAIVMDEAAAAVGEIWGTPYYIAPEKLDNQPEDFRSDIYSLGGTLFHALSGRPPYEAETASMVALKQLKSQPVSLQSFAPDVSSETAYVVNRMLAKNPDERYGSYEELIEHLSYARGKLLERIRRPHQPKARVVVEDEKTRRFTGLISLGLLAAALIAAGIMLYVFKDALFRPAASRPAAVFVEADFDSAMAEGVELAAGMRSDEAREAFRALAETPGVPQPRLNWARMNLGLANLLAGNNLEASKIFQTGRDGGLYTTEEPGIKIADFFVETARLLSTPDKPVDSRTARLFSSGNFEAFAILAFAVHNWELGNISEAAPLFEIFSRARMSNAPVWLAGYKQLAEIFSGDAEILKTLSAQAAKAATPAEIESVKNEITAARARLRTGSRASEALDKLVESLAKGGS
ncbi:MAG: serine/threonine protein kinase, partial [Terrimicrobiaceae bacterium]|nr:serine/threonine protein kinase [Terrimicrobiaceae bacterium]